MEQYEPVPYPESIINRIMSSDFGSTGHTFWRGPMEHYLDGDVMGARPREWVFEYVPIYRSIGRAGAIAMLLADALRA